ncbi:MAG: sigma-70 family RNA polymerase sigma factor [Alphaproteobacteria bacterium]|nr:sigma-70 family RNA polymerase sigma factor [Alphaproteobacteria bacterium]
MQGATMNSARLGHARSTTKLDEYLPPVAEAMREQGILSLMELYQACQQFPDYQSIARAARGARDLCFTREDYSIAAISIAAALKREPEELFGPHPKLKRELIAAGHYAHERPFDDESYFDSETPDFLIQDKISKALLTLTPKEERVLRMRFGMAADGYEYTLREAADLLAVSTERIRQHEARALRKLKHPSRGRDLRQLCQTP